VPNLGIVKYRDYKSFVMADIPGIIEGASEGKGLGLRFLRHIERNSTLLFLVPADAKDVIQEYKILLHELDEYNPELLHKKRILAISKCDLMDEELLDELKKDMNKRFKEKKTVPVLYFSAQTGQGLTQLKDELWKQLNAKDNVFEY
jgi:GTP-binding protein